MSSSEIKFVLSRLGVDFSDEELGEMIQVSSDFGHQNNTIIQEADINGDQHVSFEEFKDIFNEG